ncbi:MAG: hypothetical protein O2954_12970, partial [bacterium]|nr:hypothetical protein [bacterium]
MSRLSIWQVVVLAVFLVLPMNQDSVQAKTTLEEQSQFGPDLTFHNGRIYMAWTGRDAAGKGGKLNVMYSKDGVDWKAKIILEEKSEHPPALASFNGKLYLAWTGRDKKINIRRSEEGIDWGGKVTLEEQSELEPGLS